MCERSLLAVAWQAAQITESNIPALSHTAAAALRFVKRMESVLAIRYHSEKWEWRLPGISVSNHQAGVWFHYSLSFSFESTLGWLWNSLLRDFVCLRLIVSESGCVINFWQLATFSFWFAIEYMNSTVSSWHVYIRGYSACLQFTSKRIFCEMTQFLWTPTNEEAGWKIV